MTCDDCAQTADGAAMRNEITAERRERMSGILGCAGRLARGWSSGASRSAREIQESAKSGGGTELPVVHTVELLDWAYGGPAPSDLARRA